MFMTQYWTMKTELSPHLLSCLLIYRQKIYAHSQRRERGQEMEVMSEGD